MKKQYTFLCLCNARATMFSSAWLNVFQAWRYLCVPQSCKDTLQEMMDFSLLKDFGFLLICIGNIMTFLGFYVPFVYVVDFAVSHGIDKGKAAFLISVIGQ